MKLDDESGNKFAVAAEISRYFTPIGVAVILFMGSQVWGDIKDIAKAVTENAKVNAVQDYRIDSIERRVK